MPRYEFKHIPNTPLTRVYVDGVPDQAFTSLYAAQCWVDHRKRIEEAPCDCYGCVTMRHPCVNEKR